MGRKTAVFSFNNLQLETFLTSVEINDAITGIKIAKTGLERVSKRLGCV